MHTRRAFLKHGSAALAVGCARDVFGQNVSAVTSPGGAFRQAVACSRREAGEAARDILLQGGNAIDAAVAALLVQCVIEPNNVGIGGYGGSLVYYEATNGRVQAIDFDSRAPRNFDPTAFNASTAVHGYLAVGVPGIPAGIDLALREHGRIPFTTLAKRALAHAENGIAVTPQLARSFERLSKDMDAVSRRAYFPHGVPAEGSIWVQPDLARLIRRLGDEGIASFYDGDIATTIARQVQSGGGVLTAEDFHDFRATVVEPLRIDYRGYEVFTPPLPSGGLTSLSVLKTLEQFDLSQLAPWGPEYIELFAGASNLAWGERFKYFGDPDFVKVPVEELLSDKRAAERAEILRRGTPTIPSQSSDSSHTVNLVVVDKEQNLVSFTATHGGDFGAHVAIEGFGLVLGHGMSRFAYSIDSPNYPAAGKRPQHNMAPVVILRRGKPYAGVGLHGGRFIVSVTPQLIVNLIDFKARPRETVAAPRIHTEGQEPILVTSNTAGTVVDELKRRDHRVDIRESLGGDANVVVINPGTKGVQAAASTGSTGVLMF